VPVRSHLLARLDTLLVRRSGFQSAAFDALRDQLAGVTQPAKPAKRKTA